MGSMGQSVSVSVHVIGMSCAVWQAWAVGTQALRLKLQRAAALIRCQLLFRQSCARRGWSGILVLIVQR